MIPNSKALNEFADWLRRILDRTFPDSWIIYFEAEILFKFFRQIHVLVKLLFGREVSDPD